MAVAYNVHIPIEAFDVVFTDECHRSIYNLWRQVLEYFDAFLVGLTATPSKQTLGFFDKRQRAPIPGLRCGSRVARARDPSLQSTAPQSVDGSAERVRC